jgi:GTP-binding protein HflX
MQLDASVLIFDRELSATQASAISQVSDMRVLDRTQLILDIFAQRAQSVDGKLQVELAQTRYLLPRLGTRDDALSRLTGGIGGRGPGETKLEMGRRRARERISVLESRLKRAARQRQQRRALRGRHSIAIVAIVGYTNAGKSTLLNALTGSDVLAEDKLFATLDPCSRRMLLDGRQVVLTDTVGLIRDLPKDLFAAFRATFEEASDADLLLHVVDASDPTHDEHLRTTEAVLEELGLGNVKRLLVLNKTDVMDAEQVTNIAARTGGVPISARDPRCVEALRRLIGQELNELDAVTAAHARALES